MSNTQSACQLRMFFNIQSRLKVSIRVASKPAFLMCIGGWCQPMIEVELPYLLDFSFSYP
jgi:hypothetical protein